MTEMTYPTCEKNRAPMGRRNPCSSEAFYIDIHTRPLCDDCADVHVHQMDDHTAYLVQQRAAFNELLGQTEGDIYHHRPPRPPARGDTLRKLVRRLHLVETRRQPGRAGLAYRP